MKHFSSILIPNWIEQIILSNDMSHADVLDYKKVREVLSPQDVQYLLKFQNLNLTNFKAEVFGASSTNLHSAWSLTAQEHGPELDAHYRIALVDINKYETFLTSLVTRFQTASVLGESGEDFTFHNLKKSIASPEVDVFAIVLGEGVLGKEGSMLTNLMSNELQFTMTEEFLKQLYAVLPTSQVLLLPISRQYVELMRTRVNNSAF